MVWMEHQWRHIYAVAKKKSFGQLWRISKTITYCRHISKTITYCRHIPETIAYWRWEVNVSTFNKDKQRMMKEVSHIPDGRDIGDITKYRWIINKAKWYFYTDSVLYSKLKTILIFNVAVYKLKVEHTLVWEFNSPSVAVSTPGEPASNSIVSGEFDRFHDLLQ